MFSLLKWLFGTAQDRIIRRYRTRVQAINQRYEHLKTLPLEQIQAITEDLKQRYQNGSSLDSLLEEAFANLKAMCWQMRSEKIEVMGRILEWNMVPYDEQIIGAIAMFEGNIAEMQTGEGKTLTATMPLYLHALSGKPVHLVTVNDYLAERDKQWAGILLERLGLSTASLTQATPNHERAIVYQADVVYGTASEFGFDYLRDNSMAQTQEQQVQRGHYFAIVDEIDSILIDEARTPLIISGPSHVSYHMYEELKDPVSTLIRLQREQSGRLIGEAKKILDDIGATKDEPNLSSSDQLKLSEACQYLWKVSKSTPHNKMLMKLRELPHIRKALDEQDLRLYIDSNKAEKEQFLSDLYLVVDERRNEFELTDLGIEKWTQIHTSLESQRDASQDFVMLDLAEAYESIDANLNILEEEKLNQKVAVREEDVRRKERSHNLRQLLRAHLLMDRDVDYIIVDEKIVIIDENTGRPQPGRRFSDGLHQAIEAKENVPIQKETQTYATITLQNYFRLYNRLSGMSGTAITEEKEFKETYGVGVVSIPTHCSTQRQDANDLVYMTEREKYAAILKDVKALQAEGRPILIGTDSVETSEKLARIFKQNGIEHVILNAKNHAQEAEIIARAGQAFSVTISTNMAGRGTDITLGQGVAARGGLHVIGTTRHYSRRIDRQLRGRGARMGDPGSSQFYISFEDQLLRLFANERISSLLQKFRPPEGEPISTNMLTRSIETAQKRVEQHHFNMRKHTLEYDNVMNVQRTEIYSFRNELLHSEDMIQLSNELLSQAVEAISEQTEQEQGWSSHNFVQHLCACFPIHFDESLMPTNQSEAISFAERILKEALDFKLQLEIKKFHAIPIEVQPLISQALKMLALRRLDAIWQEHLLAMDHLRSDVQLRALGQKDPLMEYKHEAFTLFQKLSQGLTLQICQDFFRFELTSNQQENTDLPSVEDQPSLRLL
jgi:preprotein translocase subunit SecA